MHCIDAGNAALKYLVGHYPSPSDYPEIVAGDRSTPAQEKLAYSVVMMAGSGLKPAITETGYVVQTNCHASTGQSHVKC